MFALNIPVALVTILFRKFIGSFHSNIPVHTSIAPNITAMVMLSSALYYLYRHLRRGTLIRVGTGITYASGGKRESSSSTKLERRSWFLKNLKGNRKKYLIAIRRVAPHSLGNGNERLSLYIERNHNVQKAADGHENHVPAVETHFQAVPRFVQPVEENSSAANKKSDLNVPPSVIDLTGDDSEITVEETRVESVEQIQSTKLEPEQQLEAKTQAALQQCRGDYCHKRKMKKRRICRNIIQGEVCKKGPKCTRSGRNYDSM